MFFRERSVLDLSCSFCSLATGEDFAVKFILYSSLVKVWKERRQVYWRAAGTFDV